MLLYVLSILSSAQAQTVELHADAQAAVTTDVQATVEVAAPRVELQSPRLELDPNAVDAVASLFSTRFAIEAGLGLADDDAVLDHVGTEIAIDAEILPLPWLGFGVRGAGMRLENPEAGETQADVTAWMVSGGPRFTLFTDEAQREAFRLEVGAGYRFATAGAEDGMILEAAFGRQIAWTEPGATNSLGATFLVRAQQGVGAASSYRAAFLAAQVQWENGFDPSNDGAGTSSFRYTIGTEGMIGASIVSQAPVEAPSFTGGANLSLGFPLGPWLEPRVRVDVLQHTGSNGSSDLMSIAPLAGVRLRFNEAIPMYIDAHGGYAFVSDPPGSEVRSGPIADFGIGVRVAPCKSTTHQLSNDAFTFGVRTRLGLYGNEGLDAIYGTIGYEYGAGSPVFERQCGLEEPEEPELVAVETPVVTAETPVTPDTLVTPDGTFVTPGTTIVTPGTTTTTVTTVTTPSNTTVTTGYETEYELESDGGGSFRFPIRFGYEGFVGWADADHPTNHISAGMAFPLDFRITRHFGLGMRLNLQTMGEASTDLNGDRIDDADEGKYDTIALWGGPRLLIFSDEADRQGWTFELDGGWIWGEGENGPAFEVVIGRQAGGLGGSVAADLALQLRYQQGLADMADYRAVLFGAAMNLEFAVLAPEDDAGESSFNYLFGAYGVLGATLSDSPAMDAGTALGGGLEFGIPITAALVPMIRAEMLSHPATDPESPSVVSYAGFAGARIRFDEFMPLSVDAGVGYGAHFGSFESSVPDGGVVDFGIATDFGCIDSDSRFMIGVRGRVGLTGNREADAILFTVGATYAGGEPMFGRDTVWCRAADAPPDYDDYYVPSGGEVWIDSGTNTSIEVGGSTEVEVGIDPIGVEIGGSIQVPNIGVEVPSQVRVQPGSVQVQPGNVQVQVPTHVEIRPGNIQVQVPPQPVQVRVRPRR